MLTRLRSMLVKESLQLRRDRRLVGILIIAPLIQLLVLGSAANTDVREIRLAVRDQDHSRHSRDFVRSVGASGYFRMAVADGPAAGDADLLTRARAGLVVVIPDGFGADLDNGRVVSVQALVDGADSNFAVIGLNYLQKAARLFSERAQRLHRAATATAGPRPRVEIDCRAWYNPDLRSRHYLVPAVLGVLIMVTTMVVSSMGLVKEREEGTMEQVIVTPLRAGEIIAGKLLPYVAVGFIEVTLALPVIIFGFGIPLRGALPLFYLFTGIFLLTTLGLGLFISTLVKTQQQAMMISTFFVMLPFVMLSGFIFPVENMPDGIRHFAAIVPLRYYLNAVRGLFLKGTGMRELWPNAVVLLGWGLGILAIATGKFRKRLD